MDQYHRPRTQHRNVDGLSTRTNDYMDREKIMEKLPEVSDGFNLMSQKDYEELPIIPYFDKHGHLIPNHPEHPPEARAQIPMLNILRKEPKNKPPKDSTGSAPWYPQIQWETTPTEPDPTLKGMPAE